jgi:hypothetical protein
MYLYTNPPARMSADSRLRASLRAEGMLNPLVCADDPHYDGAPLRVTLGVRRLYFWRELYQPTVDVVLVSHTPSQEFSCEELELSSTAVEAKFAPGWMTVKLCPEGVEWHMKSNEFQF